MDLRFTKIGLNFKQNSGPQHCKSRVCRIFMILKSRILKSHFHDFEKLYFEKSYFHDFEKSCLSYFHDFEKSFFEKSYFHDFEKLYFEKSYFHDFEKSYFEKSFS